MTVLVLLDFSKAFDSINHRLLCHKLRTAYLFESPAVKLIDSYLSGRTQYVEFNLTRSETETNTCGVPQGSILGPILFSLFINDLPGKLKHCHYHLYADDFQLYITGTVNQLSELLSKLNADLQEITVWSAANGLTLNAQKTQAIIIRKSSANVEETLPIKLNGLSIPLSDQIKNLGLIIDSHLSWKPHVNKVCNQIFYSLHTLVSLKHLTPFNVRMKLAKTLIVPLFQYCDVIFSSANGIIMKKLYSAFNAVTRYVHNLSKYDHISQYSKSLLGCSFPNYVKYRYCCTVFKVLYESPNYLANFFQRGRSTRTNDLILPRINSSATKHSFKIRGIGLWNGLPQTCKSAISFSLFKSLSFKYFSTLTT